MRKLVLLTALVAAIMAMAATTAVAATEVRDANGQLCAPVVPAINTSNPPVNYGVPGSPPPYSYVSGGCTVHMTALTPTKMYQHQQMVDCRINFDLHIGPDGWGYADHFVYQNANYCNYPTNWTTPGSRIVMPRNVNPNGFYFASNANTDFNVEMYAERNHPANAVRMGFRGFVSLDVTQGNPLAITNQLLNNPFGTGWTGGSWQGDAGLIVTH